MWPEVPKLKDEIAFDFNEESSVFDEMPPPQFTQTVIKKQLSNVRQTERKLSSMVTRLIKTKGGAKNFVNSKIVVVNKQRQTIEHPILEI